MRQGAAEAAAAALAASSQRLLRDSGALAGSLERLVKAQVGGAGLLIERRERVEEG